MGGGVTDLPSLSLSHTHTFIRRVPDGSSRRSRRLFIPQTNKPFRRCFFYTSCFCPKCLLPLTNLAQSLTCSLRARLPWRPGRHLHHLGIQRCPSRRRHNAPHAPHDRKRRDRSARRRANTRRAARSGHVFSRTARINASSWDRPPRRTFRSLGFRGFRAFLFFLPLLLSSLEKEHLARETVILADA